MSETISDKILIARQAIFDRNLNVFAYELLFRNSEANQSGVDKFNGDEATTQVINNAFLEFGIDKIVGKKLAFINLTDAFINGELSLPFETDQAVLEVLEDVTINNKIIAGVEKFKQKGFTVALDDFIYREELLPLITAASIIKIDILALSEAELIEHVEILKQHKVDLLAEKVETAEQYELCKKLGFKYFQGYFFCRPTLIDGKALPDNKLAILRILCRLEDSDITIEELEQLVKEDVSLTFKLLRLLNSASLGLPKKVDSIQQGLVYLGLKTIKSWTTVIASSALEPKTSELMTAALIRAKMSAEVAHAFNCNEDTAFMTGLFSLLDAILEQPMNEVVNSLPVDDVIKDALLLKVASPLSELLLFVINCEQGKLETIPENMTISQINQAYLTATEWVGVTEDSLCIL